EQELARVLARPGARVPALGPAAEHALIGLDGAADGGALLLAAHRPRLVPAPAVAEQVVVVLAHPLGDGRVELERDGSGRDRHRHVRLVEDAGEPPDAGAAPVLVVRLGAGVAVGRLDARVGVFAPAVVAVVAPEDGVFRPLLIDKDEVHDDAGAVRPVETRRGAAVADQVAPLDRLRDHRGSIAEKAGRAVTVSRSSATFGHGSNESGILYQRQSTGAKAMSASVKEPTTVPLAATNASMMSSLGLTASIAAASSAWSASSGRLPPSSIGFAMSPIRSAGKNAPRNWVLHASSPQSTAARASGSLG